MSCQSPEHSADTGTGASTHIRNPKLPSTELHRCIRDLILPVCRSIPDISAAYLFGSMARGDYHRDSDVDLWVHIDDSVLDRPFGLSRAVQALRDAIPRKSDIVTATRSEQLRYIYGDLLRDGVLLYERKTDGRR